MYFTKQSFFILHLICWIFFLSPQVQAKSEELRIGVNSEYETLHPVLSATAVARYIIYFSYRPLVYLDEQSHLQPMLVKSIPSLKDKSAVILNEKNKKALLTHWELKEGLKWGDGHAITCEDLKFAWQMGLNTNVSLATRDEFDEIESITWEEKAPLKCDVKFKIAKWDFAVKMPAPLPKHLESEILSKYGTEREGYDRNSWYQKDPTKKGLWNGPYVVSEAKLGSHIVFTPNEHYFGQKPKIKKIVIRMITNSGALEANLRSHNIDMVSRIGLDLDQALVLNKKISQDKLPFQVVFQDGVTYYHIDVNLDHPILKDLKVRQALSYGLNKQEILSSIFDGKAAIAHHFTAPIDRLYTEDKSIVSIYTPDKRKAKQLLEDAGWKVEPDGYRYKEGKKLSFSLSLDTGSKVNETFASIIQSQWKDIGVDLQVKPEVARYLFTEIIPKRKFDLGMYAWISFPENSQKAILNSKNIPSEKNTWTGQNFTGFKNKAVDKLADEYEYEFDPEKRKKINSQLLKHYTQEVMVIPLYFRGENAVIPAGLKNFKLTGHLFFESLKSEHWEL